LFGGGDAKMISALSFWMGTQGLAHFLMVMAIAGGVLALISVGLRRTNVGKRSLNKLNNTINSEWLHAMVADKTLVPYGIAIAIGAIAGFYGAFILP
jgi:prepilin peptidase CpaA